MGTTSVVAFATLFSAAALIMVALSFGTDHWIEYTFARWAVRKTIERRLVPFPEGLNASLHTDPRMFTRYRGLFRTCFPGKETWFLDSYPKLIEGYCLPEEGYELFQPLETTVKYPTGYHTRKHLMRAHFAFFVCAMLSLLLVCFVGAAGCWSLSKNALLTAGIIAFFGAFFTAAGMAVFHGYEYLEKQVINLEMFPKGWPSVVSNNTSLQYGWSYMVGWLGMSIAVIAAILYLWAAYSVVYTKYSEKKPCDEYHLKSSRNMPSTGYIPSPEYMMSPGVGPPTLEYPPHHYAQAYPDYRAYRY